MSRDMRVPMRANVGFAANMFSHPFQAFVRESRVNANITSLGSVKAKCLVILEKHYPKAVWDSDLKAFQQSFQNHSI